MFRLILVLLFTSLQGCTYLLFHPQQTHLIRPDVLGIKYEDIYIDTRDKITLHGWKLYASTEPKGTVLFFHGNAENISTHVGHVYWLTEFGYNVIAVDYRGYGHSDGQPQLAGMIEDIQSALLYVAKNEKQKLFVLGQSLGGSLVIAAVAQSESRSGVDAVISVGAFSDYHRITRQVLSRTWFTWLFQWPLSFTINNTFSPQNFISKISPVPVLIMHGVDDDVVPVSHADDLYGAAIEPKYIEKVPGDHNHLLDSRDNRALLVKYLEKFNNN